MFDLNFISEPGMQNETSDANWSFLFKQNIPDESTQSDSEHLKTPMIQQNSWKNYAFVMIILGFITLISIINSNYTRVEPDLEVLNQVIDLIDESSYITNLQLAEANFSTDQISVTIRSKDFPVIQSLSQDYRMENEIPYQMYQKGKFSYLYLIFPWNGNEKGGDITNLQSMVDKIVLSNKTMINHSEDIFEIQGGASDIISILLKMAENDQIQKFNFSVFHQNADQFNLIVKN